MLTEHELGGMCDKCRAAELAVWIETRSDAALSQRLAWSSRQLVVKRGASEG